MNLLVNDLIVYTGSKEECIAKLDKMVLQVVNGDLKTIAKLVEYGKLFAIVEIAKYPELGQIHWHVEYEPNGGVFKHDDEFE